jgi:large subunit ribosomal protein L17
MRHGRKINHLGRTASHRKALLSNMAASLIVHKRINTTVAKAKALRRFIEPLITKSKTDTTHSRRMVFAYLQDKEAVRILFDEVARKVVDRPGGYVRILKTDFRLGDNADMCMMELVDYNSVMLANEKAGAVKRTRRGRKKATTATQSAAVENATETPTAE